MAAIDRAMVSKILNALGPTGTNGAPGTMITALGGSPMKLKLTSDASTNAASGTELTGTGYSAGGTALGVASTASSNGSSVTLPKTTPVSWTNGSGGNWTIYSVELTDSAGLRVWFGNVTGAPVTVANGNTFSFAADSITLSLT
jgi:hypothetical protein